jgi:drug/metabolite transporter (DMT)-like permease
VALTDRAGTRRRPEEAAVRGEAAPAGAPRAVAGAAVAGVLLAALATLVWSGSFVATRALGATVPPVQAAFWRWAVALAVVAPFGARAAWRQRALLRRHPGWLLLASLLGVTVYNTLVHQAGTTTPAGTMGLVMAASPVLMALYERLGGVRLGARRTTGTLVACGGVVLLLGARPGTEPPGPADLWIVAAAVCFGSYSALLRRRPAGLGGPALLFATFALGTLLLLPVYAVDVTLRGGFAATPGTVGPLLYLGVFSSAVAFFAWNRAVQLIGAARAGVVYHLQPLCVALLAYLLLDEVPGPVGPAAMALVLGGVALGAAPGPPRRRAG